MIKKVLKNNPMNVMHITGIILLIMQRTIYLLSGIDKITNPIAYLGTICSLGFVYYFIISKDNDESLQVWTWVHGIVASIVWLNIYIGIIVYLLLYITAIYKDFVNFLFHFILFIFVTFTTQLSIVIHAESTIILIFVLNIVLMKNFIKNNRLISVILLLITFILNYSQLGQDILLILLCYLYSKKGHFYALSKIIGSLIILFNVSYLSWNFNIALFIETSTYTELFIILSILMITSLSLIIYSVFEFIFTTLSKKYILEVQKVENYTFNFDDTIQNQTQYNELTIKDKIIKYFHLLSLIKDRWLNTI